MALAEAHPSPTPTWRHRFTVDQYHRMAETGVLKMSERIELLNGEIIDMTPVGKEHSGVVNFLSAYLHTAAQGRAIISVQNPILLDDRSEPQPDLAVLKTRADYYRKDLPRPEDVLLLIEVADTSLDTDRRVKVPLYAAAGIPEVCLIDLGARTLEVFQKPANGRFQQCHTIKRPAVTAPAVFPDQPLKLDLLFQD